MATTMDSISDGLEQFQSESVVLEPFQLAELVSGQILFQSVHLSLSVFVEQHPQRLVRTDYIGLDAFEFCSLKELHCTH